MSFSAPRLLRLLVCASALHESAPTADSTILEQLPIDFIVNSGQWQTPARFEGAFSTATIERGPGSTVYTGYRQYPMRSR